MSFYVFYYLFLYYLKLRWHIKCLPFKSFRSIRTRVSVIPNLDSKIKAGLVTFSIPILNSEAIRNTTKDGWKFPYMSCKFSHAVEAVTLIAQCRSPLGPTAFVSQVRRVSLCVGWHVVFPESMLGPDIDTLAKPGAHEQLCVRPLALQFPGQQ